MEPLFSENFRVRIDEADWTGRVTPVSLLNYLQDAAYQHAAEMGIAMADLRQQRLTWVLSRYFIRFFQYPKLKQNVQVRTWPSARDGRFTHRDYEVIADAQPVVAATCSWALLNIDTRRPVLLDEFLPAYPLRPSRSLEFPADKIPLADTVDGEVHFPVRRSDLDVNRHVNHTVYVEWALESLPSAAVEDCRLAELEIAYRAEALYGDTVCARYHRLPSGPEPAFLHQLVSDADGREFARLRSVWRPIPR
jgi:acyl-ACP thioesterase